MTTHWNCPNCGKRGNVRHGYHAGVFEVFDAIRTNHKVKSPGCGALVSEIKVSLEDAVFEERER